MSTWVRIPSGPVDPLSELPEPSDRSRLGGVKRRLGAFVDGALDRMVSEPFEVGARDEAVQLMSEPPPESALMAGIPTIAALVTRGGAMYRRVRAARTATGAAGGPAGISAMVLTAAGVAAVTRLLTAVRWGMRDVQVMASYLAKRSQVEGVELESGLARSLAISAYLDPRRRARLDYANVRGAGALVGAWSTQTIASRNETAARRRAEPRIDALDRYDLHALAAEWNSRH
jgi:hypothetical protein